MSFLKPPGSDPMDSTAAGAPREAGPPLLLGMVSSLSVAPKSYADFLRPLLMHTGSSVFLQK